MLNPTPSPAALLLLTSLLSLTSAQNSTNSTNSTTPSCIKSSFDIPPGAKVNATGSTSWHWDSVTEPNVYSDPWYLSILLNDTARGGYPSYEFGGIKMHAYLSVPRNIPNDTQICAYQFGSLNATLEDNEDGEHSCKGAVSDECMKFLDENWGSKGAGRCPGFLDGPGGRDGWEEKCPMLSGSGTSVNDVSFWRPSNTTCHYPSLPDVDLPENYTTHGLPSAFSPFKDYYGTNDTMASYDLMTKQVIPYVFVARLAVPPSNSEQTLHRAICVVPGKAVEGSREVDEEPPWKDSGAGEVRGKAGLVGAVVGALVVGGMVL